MLHVHNDTRYIDSKRLFNKLLPEQIQLVLKPIRHERIVGGKIIPESRHFNSSSNEKTHTYVRN